MAVFAVVIPKVCLTQPPSLNNWHFIESTLTISLLPPLDSSFLEPKVLPSPYITVMVVFIFFFTCSTLEANVIADLRGSL